jgi:hypothetical protein
MFVRIQLRKERRYAHEHPVTGRSYVDDVRVAVLLVENHRAQGKVRQRTLCYLGSLSASVLNFTMNLHGTQIFVMREQVADRAVERFRALARRNGKRCPAAAREWLREEVLLALERLVAKGIGGGTGIASLSPQRAGECVQEVLKRAPQA